jgi:hypothetical protein
MLTIDQRPAVQRLANLEQLTIAVLSDARRIEAQHRIERHPAASRTAARHSHPPVRRHELVASTRATLVVEVREENAVLHQHPPITLRGRL